MPKARSSRNRQAEVERLRLRLAEAEETLAAIRGGDVDAIAVDGPHGRQVFTLHSAEQPYRILAEHMSEGAASLGVDGTILFCNERLAQMLGRRPEKVVGSRVTDLVAEGEGERFRKLLVSVSQSERRMEMQLQRADGSHIPVLASVEMFPAGQSHGFCLVATDLTDLKRREAEKSDAQDAARRLALIVTSSSDAIVAKDLAGIITSWNPGAEAIYGYSAAEMIGKSITRVVPPDRVSEFRAMMGKIALGQQVRGYETVRTRKDGQAIHVSLSVAPLKDQTGKVVGVSTISRDITERKHAEEKLREASLYTRGLIEASLDPLVTISKDGKITDVNVATEKATGIARERLIGTDFSDYFTVPEKARQGYQRVFDEGLVRDYPLAIRNASGAVMQVLYNATVFKGTSGEVEGVFAAARDITETKRAEDKLREISIYTRGLIEASLDPLVTISKDGKIMDVNAATEMATGVSREQLIGSDFSDYFTDPEKARRGYERVFAEESVRDYPLAIRHVSGSVMDVLYNATLFRSAEGEVEGVFAAARDITERKRAEERLCASELRVRMLLDSTAEAIFGEDLQGQCTFCNPAAARLLGYGSAAELLGKDVHALMHHSKPDGTQLPAADCPLAQATRTGQAHHADDLVFWRKDGSPFPAECWSHPLTDSGNTIGSVVTFLDVTERKRAEEKLRESSLYARSLIEASLDPLVTISRDGKITDVNQATEKATGVARQQLIGSDFSSYFTEPQNARRGYEEVFAQGFVHDYPLAIRHTSDHITDVLYNASVLRNKKGEIEGVFAAARDVTARKRAETALQRERQRFREVLDRLPVYVVLLTPDYHVALDNTVFRERFGESHGRHCYDFLFGRNEPCEICESYSVLKTGSPHQWKWTGPDGRNYDIYDFPFTESDGSPLILEMGMDITERMRAEAEVRRLNNELEQRVIQRTAQLQAANRELEAFTYSVSHDLRAPLRHISGFSKILAEEFASSLPTEAQHHVQRIQEGTRRMGQLVDDLLNLGRVGRRALSLQVAGLRSIVDEVLSNLKSDVGDRHVEWKIGDLPYVECDTALIRQVFQNLLSNALKFTRPRAEAVIEIGQEQRKGASVVFVRDNGVGFSMKYADKLFGVFQRLHRAEDFEGTGVGLATVQRIIEKHGGRIWAEAELDKGASFYFTLGNSETSGEKTKAMIAGEES